eukprot:2804007-Amphidinium_carterae.1
MSRLTELLKHVQVYVHIAVPRHYPNRATPNAQMTLQLKLRNSQAQFPQDSNNLMPVKFLRRKKGRTLDENDKREDTHTCRVVILPFRG